MTPTAQALALTLALGAASPAAARDLTLTVDAASWRGHEAYMAAYVVDPSGAYVGTVHVAAGSPRYLQDLSRWYRLAQRARSGVDGTTGASIGQGQEFSTTVSLPDAMFNAGYVLRVESAVERGSYVPDDAAVALDDAQSGQAVAGSGYVDTLTATF